LGQRARRKMAEQAFGDSAKHIAPSHAQRRPAAAAAAPDLVGRAAAHLQALPPPPRQGAGATQMLEAPPAAAAAELHPSWAAKSAAKAQLAAKPAGKKVVFSDDGDEISAADVANVARQQRAAQGSGLHARGAAEVIVRAEGSQQPQAVPQAASRVPGVPRHRDQHRPSAHVVPGSSSKKRPAAKLHPSWEAKAKLRKQMESLPAPSGTKVVFDDSD
jgi:BUD22